VTEVPLLPVEIELGKARRLLAAAEHLARGGFHEDAVSRAYYAVFHAGCALLASIGRTVRTHDGLRATIGEHFVRTGRLAPRFARVLTRSAADRNDADYNSTATFLAEDAHEAIQGAREFVAAVEGLVATEPV
jgi:uncharacterized protein (UPF0332 family)